MRSSCQTIHGKPEGDLDKVRSIIFNRDLGWIHLSGSEQDPVTLFSMQDNETYVYMEGRNFTD